MKSHTPLTIFIQVIESGSFSSAARHFNMAPSAISRQISHLEKELGARLFHRTTRKQSLTEAGEIYYQYAQRVQAELEAAEVAVNELSDSPKGILHVTTEKDFAEAFIQPLLPAFFEQYPGIQLHLSLGANIVNLVADGIDLAIRIGHLDNSNLIARKLMSSPSIVCASPEYLAKNGYPIEPSDLKHHNCLSFRTNTSSTTWNFKRAEQSIKVPVSGNLTANSVNMLKNAALNDLGVIFIPQWFVQQELKEGSLLAMDFQSSETPVNAVFANNRQLAPKVRVFIDFFAKHLPLNS
ncbi:MAG: LysR substrate-binding domain-containing protein [Arenicella sp.]